MCHDQTAPHGLASRFEVRIRGLVGVALTGCTRRRGLGDPPVYKSITHFIKGSFYDSGNQG